MIEDWWDALKIVLFNSIWAVNVARLSRGHAFVVRSLRVMHMLVREISSGDLNQRAASLVFTTLLSMVPLLAVSFSVLKAFGVHQELQGLLYSFLAPLGDRGMELSNRIMAFVDNVNGKVLGGIGLLLLMVTVVSLLHKVERAFNRTWRVARPRGFFERFSGYLSVVLVGPVLVFTALGITASVLGSPVVRHMMAVGPLGPLLRFAASAVPYLLVTAAFTFVYVFIPNTRVRVRSAAVGAAVAALLWEAAGWGFAAFVVSSPRYAAIYSSFAVAFLFMLWLYVAWLILLVGGTVAFYHQHPEYQGLLADEFRLSSRLRERTALSAFLRIAQHHLHGLAPVATATLASELRVPLEPLERVLVELCQQGLLVEVRGATSAYVPARDLGSIKVADTWQAVRRAFEGKRLNLDSVYIEPAIQGLLDGLENAATQRLGQGTWRELAEAHPPPLAPAAEPDLTGAVPIDLARRERRPGE